MYCKNCGNQYTNEDKFCGVCGYPINTNPNQKIETQEEKTLSNLLTLLSFILFFPVSFFVNMVGLNQISGFPVLAGLALLIYVKIKYPKNIWATVLMWLIIIYFIIMVFFIIFVIVSCSIALNDCQGFSMVRR